MAKSIKAQTSVGTRAFCVGVVGLAFGVSAAIAQTATAPTVRPPVARQIEPMVSPVKRVAPKTAAPAIVAASQPAAGAAQKTPASVLAAGLVPPAAAVGAQQPSTTPKIVVHTCKLGQDFSEKLKACFTPGVTKVVSATKAVKAKVGAEIETARKSALGAAKRKS